MLSETSKVRPLILPFLPEAPCFGIDIGFGGDLIRKDFLGCDMPTPYVNYGGLGYNHPFLGCDVSTRIPVKDKIFDCVYSSHLIEDFQDTHKILAEFLRIIKNGGILVLVFPDQQKYAEHCQKLGESSNPHHQIPEMGVDYMLDCLRKFKKITVRKTMEIEPYNCIIVAVKTS